MASKKSIKGSKATKVEETVKPLRERKRRLAGEVIIEGESLKIKGVPFPAKTLEEAIRVAQAVNELGEGVPWEVVAVQLGEAYTKAESVVDSAEKYGIIKRAGRGLYLTDVGRDIVAPTSPDQRKSSLLEAFLHVELFKKIADYYAGQRLPEAEFFKNTLERTFNLSRRFTDKVVEVFKSNLEYLKAFNVLESGHPTIPSFLIHSAASADGPATSSVTSSDAEGVREFLDTCFILMPFGDWFDRYYKEVYVPATKDAGFEPLRADGLFKAGAVMEQIWLQIQKAKVLLADLTGKNPNVFYELGLAHALAKPVVFVAGDIEDVPFDVRHLRVVIYDVREPHWAEKLQGEITAFLKNTRADPDKSIPQPFREGLSETPETSPTVVPVAPARRRSRVTEART